MYGGRQKKCYWTCEVSVYATVVENLHHMCVWEGVNQTCTKVDKVSLCSGDYAVLGGVSVMSFLQRICWCWTINADNGFIMAYLE